MIEKDETKNHKRHIYHLGQYRNFIEVMGPIYLWLLPVSNISVNDGYSYEINEEIYEEFKKKRKIEKEINKNNHTISLLLKN
jgi:hypothetical protein